MDEDDLKKIREERLRQLKQQGGGSSGGGNNADDHRQQQQQRQQEARQSLLSQILEPEAADRLARIRMVKEERAAQVEDRLLTLAQAGQLRGKVTEEQLKDLLHKISAAEDAARGTSSSAGRIVVERRGKGWFDDEEDDLDWD